jgi:hypothetical protein
MMNIESEYFQKTKAILNYHEVNQNLKETWSTKEKYKDCSTSYPSYGRGMTPNIKMNTFMIQENMAKVEDKKPELPADVEVPKSDEPQPNSQAQQRTRIIEPHRKKFEKQWEDWMNNKYVRQPVGTIDERHQGLMVPPNFDTQTKVNSQNLKVEYNQLLQ